jgi:predicted metal-dependent hydrolase
MSKDKIKYFQEFIKQDFDVVEDYKASKEMTPNEALERLDCNSIQKYKDVDYGDYQREEYDGREKLFQDEVKIISKALSKLETLEKRDTPMKAQIDSTCKVCGTEMYWRYIYCHKCGQKIRSDSNE